MRPKAFGCHENGGTLLLVCRTALPPGGLTLPGGRPTFRLNPLHPIATGKP